MLHLTSHSTYLLVLLLSMESQEEDLKLQGDIQVVCTKQGYYGAKMVAAIRAHLYPLLSLLVSNRLFALP